MTTPLSESVKRDVQVSPDPAPREVEELRETQEVLWEQMRVRSDTAPGSWRDLAPEQRISREGFKPLVSRTSAPDHFSAAPSIETEAALKAAERYQEELRDESARAEDMLQHLDDLEGHLHALHASNDTSEELSILISYVRLEKAAVHNQAAAELDMDSGRPSIAMVGGAAHVDITRPRPTSGVKKPSEGGSSTAEGAGEDPSQDGHHGVVRRVSEQK